MVLVDEAYYELVDDTRRMSMVELVRQGANMIVARTFSKIFGSEILGRLTAGTLRRVSISAIVSIFPFLLLNCSLLCHPVP